MPTPSPFSMHSILSAVSQLVQCPFRIGGVHLILLDGAEFQGYHQLRRAASEWRLLNGVHPANANRSDRVKGLLFWKIKVAV